MIIQVLTLEQQKFTHQQQEQLLDISVCFICLYLCYMSMRVFYVYVRTICLCLYCVYVSFICLCFYYMSMFVIYVYV